MTKKILTLVLASSLVLAEALLAANPPSNPVPPSAGQPAPAATANQQAQTPQSPQYQTRARRRSYERETNNRRHGGISKNEAIFLGAVAATPMAIGAIAGGGHGLAIGAVVGGWSAVGAHYLWKHLR